MRPRILVADDDADIRKTLSLLLGSDYAVVEAANGAEALELIEVEKPRIVLLDITMPLLNGVEVLAASQRMDFRPLIIIISSEAGIELAKRTLDLGAVLYIVKPFDVQYLRREIQRLLEKQDAGDPPPNGRPWRIVP